MNVGSGFLWLLRMQGRVVFSLHVMRGFSWLSVTLISWRTPIIITDSFKFTVKTQQQCTIKVLFIHQLIHYCCLKNNIKIYMKIYTRTAPTFFGVSLLLHRASCRFTKYHTTNKCTNCMSFILNHFLKTLFTAPTCFDSISLIIIREHIQFLAKITC